MPKLRELRETKGLQARQIADAAGIDPTMYSRYENYRVLPIPADFNKIVEVLGCSPTDVYEPSEVRLLPDTREVQTVGGAKIYRKPDEYKMTVRLGNDCREVLTRKILQTCGYKSISDWVSACVGRLKIEYETAVKNEKKNPPVPGKKNGGEVKARHTTVKPDPTTNLAQKN